MDQNNEQLSPHNIEAEEAVLGAILIHSDALIELQFLTVEDFFIVRNGWVWEAIKALNERDDPIDYLTVVNELEQTERLAELGGAAYILSLVNKTPSALNAEGYGRIVERMALRRRMIDAAGQIARAAHSDSVEIDEVVSTANQAWEEVVTSSAAGVRIIGSQEAERLEVKRLARISARRAAGHSPAIPTGLPPLDNILDGGWWPETLNTVFAFTAVGKSIFLKQSALGAIAAGYRVGFISLEMGHDAIRRRMKSEAFKLSPTDLKTGRMTAANQELYEVFTNSAKEWPIFFVDNTRSWVAIKAAIKRLYIEYEVDIVFIDYSQLVQIASTPSQRFASRKDELRFITNESKGLAMKLKMPIVWAAQASRLHINRNDHNLNMGDVSDAKDIPDGSDVVIALDKPSQFSNFDAALNPNLTPHTVIKHREGELGGYNTILNTDYLYFDYNVSASKLGGS